MKKLLVLTAITMVTAASAGCECCLFRRGAMFPTTPVVAAPAPVCCDPCAPAIPSNPCDPCGTCGTCAPSDAAVSPTVLPGPGATVLPQ